MVKEKIIAGINYPIYKTFYDRFNREIKVAYLNDAILRVSLEGFLLLEYRDYHFDIDNRKLHIFTGLYTGGSPFIDAYIDIPLNAA